MHACICMVAYLHVFTNMHMRTCRNLFQNSVAYKSRSREVTAKHAQLSTSCLPARFFEFAMFCRFCRQERGARQWKPTQWRLGRAECREYNCCRVCHPTCRLNDRASMERARKRLTSWCIFMLVYVFDFFLLQSFSGIDMIFIQTTGCQERAPGLNPEPAGLH